MYNNLLNGVNGQLSQVQQQQQQQYLLTEFLKTAEGQEAHQEFIEAQTKWWNKVNGIVPKEEIIATDNARMDAIENKMDTLMSSVSSLVEQLGGDVK